MAPLFQPAASDTRIDSNTAPKHQTLGPNFMNTPRQ